MQQAFDSLGAYRRLEESGMPEPQAGATVEVVKDAMQDLVTKQFFTIELDRRFGPVDGRLDAMDSRLDTMDGRLDAMGSRLDTMDGRLDAMDSRLDTMDGRLDAMDGRLDAMDGRLDAMDSRLDAMDGRLDAMGSRLDAIDGRLDTMDSRLNAMDGRITELKIDMTQDFASLRVDMANSHKLLMATMLGTALAVIGVQLAMLTIFLRPPADLDAQDQPLETPPALQQPSAVQ